MAILFFKEEVTMSISQILHNKFMALIKDDNTIDINIQDDLTGLSSFRIVAQGRLAVD